LSSLNERIRKLNPVLAMTVGLWLFVFLLYTVRSLWNAEAPFWPQVFPRFLMCAWGAVLCGAVYLFLRAHTHRSLGTQLWLVILASTVGAAFDAVGALLISDWMLADVLPPRPRDWITTAVLNTQSFVWVFITWSCIYLTLVYSRRMRDNEMRLLEAQALASDAQNRMLRYQINPHFLFNTLNALSSLVLQKRTERAEAMLLALSGFLRYSLARSPDEAVPLREEALAQEEYLRIEQARFGERLKFIKRLDPDVDHVLVPSLILQPLIENAVKHAVAPTSAPVTIELTARRAEDRRIEVRVCDNGQGGAADAPSLGVGLENVRRRLEVAFGGRARFQHGKTAEGYCASLLIPEDQ